MGCPSLGISNPPPRPPSASMTDPSVIIISPAVSPLLSAAGSVAVTPAKQPALSSSKQTGMKRNSGCASKLAASVRHAPPSNYHTGPGARRTASKLAAALVESAEQSEAPIDVLMPLGGQPQSQMLYIPETTLKQVVAAAVAPLRDDISMTRKQFKEMKGTLGQVRQTVDAQAQSIDRMAGWLTSVNYKIDEGTRDVKDAKVVVTEDEGGPSAAQVQKVAPSNKNFINMEAERSVFK